MSHLWPDDDGNIVNDPWSLKNEGKGHMIKSIKLVRFPTGFGVKFNKAFMKGNELAGLKNHDWHNFLRVSMCALIEVIYIIYYILYYFKIILLFSFIVYFVILINLNIMYPVPITHHPSK